MKCSNCKKNYKDTLPTCPKCGEVNHKMLEDKTIAIMEVNEDLSLTGLINNQIEEFNEDNNKDIVNKDKKDNKKKKKISKKKKDTKFGTKKDIKKRKKILLSMSIVMLLIILSIVGIVFYFSRNKDTYDYVYELNIILNDYDNIEENTEIYDVLAYVVNDKDKIDIVKNNTYVAIEEWIKDYKDKEYYSSEDIENNTNILKDKIEYIRNVEYEDIELITNKEYDNFIEEIDNYYNDSKVYYDGISYYNKKYYNEAYAIFSNVEGSFESKAKLYQDKIVNNVLELLVNDINNIKGNIVDSSTDQDKLDYYMQIENVILVYDSVYSNLLLKDNKDYQTYLSEYNALVIEYTDIVYGS